MKILIYFIILFKLISCINSFDLCLVNPKKLEFNQVCKFSSDCEYPLFCGDNGSGTKVCSKSLENGKKCESSNQCAPGSICFNENCKDQLYVGDECNEKSSYCTNSRCINGVCAIDGGACTANDQCPFNNYCKSNKCVPLEKDGSACERDPDCLLTSSCCNGKCEAKYKKPIGSSCNATFECQVFSGHICNASTKKCSKYEQLMKKCKDNSDCGSNGMCLCKNENENVCVDLSTGALKNDKCLGYLDSFSSCMVRERCKENTKNCPKCYPIWMCYQYECFYMQQFFRSTQNYYKSFCPNNNNKRTATIFG